MPDRFAIIAESHKVAEPPAGDKYYRREVKQRGQGLKREKGWQKQWREVVARWCRLKAIPNH